MGPLLAGTSASHGVQLISHQEGKFDGLAGVEARIAVREVALFQITHGDIHEAPGALGDVLSRHLQVHTTRMSAHLLVHLEERHDLVANSFERSRLESVIRLDGVPVHRIGHPKNVETRLLNSANKAR